jgi:hypothetical protein
MRTVRMTPRNLLSRTLPLLVTGTIVILAACGGDDDSRGLPGQLSDPNNVPTATPWQSAPDVFILDPENIQPLPPSEPDTGGNNGGATPEPGEPGVCGETYTVVAGDTTFGIADKCRVTVEGIQDLNPEVDIRALSIGDVLTMPTPAPQEGQ